MFNQERLCGQLLIDFANARTIDEAAFGFLENVQRVLGFSDGFVEKAKEGFPLPHDPEKYSTESPKAKEIKIFYDDIAKNNGWTIQVLKEVMKGNSPQDSDLVRRFLLLYETKKFQEKMISSFENSVNQRYFQEEDFFDIYNRLTTTLVVTEGEEESWSTNVGLEFLAVLSMCLREFIKNPRNTDYLRICPFCEDFFIANDTKRKKCYSGDCRKKYEREKKRLQREKDPVKYY